MEQLVQCPVCTLYLHNGMSLESHLDTHPKDQVIKALCSLSASKSNYGSRSSTPMNSERSYGSRSRTPAGQDTVQRWASSLNHDRYWRRPPSRTPPLRTPKTNNTRTNTPSDMRMGELNFDSVPNILPGSTPATVCSTNSFSIKSDKQSRNYISSGPSSDFSQRYVYIQDPQEEVELKYSKSAEYNASSSSSSIFTYNLQAPPSSMKIPTLVPNSKRSKDYVNLNVVNNRDVVIPKPNNVALVKTNIGSLQYITPGMKAMHVVLPPSQAFMQTAPPGTFIGTTNMASSSQTVHNKSVSTPLLTNQFSQITSGTFAPNKTVVTQNSQIIYREMVHNVDGKSYLSAMPTVIGNHSAMPNIPQSTSIYPNVMVVDPYRSASGVYTPQQVLPQTTVANVCQNMSTIEKIDTNIVNNNSDKNKTVVIDVSSLSVDPHSSTSTAASSSKKNDTIINSVITIEKQDDKENERIDSPALSKKGLKILSNIKVEVPVQHHKSMLNTVVDLTDVNDTDDMSYVGVTNRMEKRRIPVTTIQPSISIEISTNVPKSSSVIKNVGNPPPSYKEATKSVIENKTVEIEIENASPVPDLTCNEKPSISPCSELSENGDNAVDRITLTHKSHNLPEENMEVEISHQRKSPTKPYWNHSMKLNNVYLKKSKKILQIKKSKLPCTSNETKVEGNISVPSSSGIFKTELKPSSHANKTTETVRPCSSTNIDSHSLLIEPVASSSFTQSNNYDNIDMVQVKVEVNSNSEPFTSGPDSSDMFDKDIESLRPMNVIAYGNLNDHFSDDSNHRELLDIDAAAKNKHFVNMLNDNYFGDNIYADYFTPDRVESFDAVRESVPYSKDTHKAEERCDGMYLWCENTPKENYLPQSFTHETSNCAVYSLNTDGVLEEVDYREQRDTEADICEQDSKLDVLSEGRSESEVALDICADERMPPRGELSGQESNGDMDTPWTGMYPEVTPAEPYDLMARESWISDGSDIDSTEKRDEEELTLNKSSLHYACALCPIRLSSLTELHAHRTIIHGSTSAPQTPDPHRRFTEEIIKKEEKSDEQVLPEAEPIVDTKSDLQSTIFDELNERKPKIDETIIKKEPRRRRDFVCGTCNVNQENEATFREHLRIHPLECLTCGKCFYSKSNLNLHMRTHLGIRNFKCEVCEKRFMTKQKLQEHSNIHTGRAPIKCTLCSETFKRYSNMVQHRNRHHFKKKKKIRDYVCHCGEVFHTKAKLKWHKETHEDKPKSCPYCSDKFIHSASLTRHVRRAHNSYYMPNGSKPSIRLENVPCPICKQICVRSGLKSHLLTHSGKRPFLCVICNKSFTTNWNLKLHKWVHMSRSSKPYKCSLCKGAFIRHSEYISHMNSHKSVRPYTCNYCGCQFIRKYNCQRHVKEHEMAKKYVCKVPDCGKTFHRSYYLTEHMRVHSGARPFSCNICGKTSSNKSNHNKHVKIHHTRDPIATEG